MRVDLSSAKVVDSVPVPVIVPVIVDVSNAICLHLVHFVVQDMEAKAQLYVSFYNSVPVHHPASQWTPTSVSILFGCNFYGIISVFQLVGQFASESKGLVK